MIAITSLLLNPLTSIAAQNKFTPGTNQLEHWGIDYIGAKNAHAKGLTGRGVKVAVIDTGIDLNHPDLEVAGGVSFVNYTNSYQDDHGHGSHVAGIIAAKNNSYGILGIAPNVELYAVKALDQNRQGPIENIVNGIYWAIENHMDIIHLSWSTSEYHEGLEQAVKQAYDAGILLVGSAGNLGTANGVGQTVRYPAKFEQVIAVAAIDQTGNRAAFSSTGEEVEVAAPGVYIYSCTIGSSYASDSGTSQAAPHVTGVLALLKEAFPQASNEELRQKLRELTIDVGPIGKDPYFGYGIVQAPIMSPPYPPYQETKRPYQITIVGSTDILYSQDVNHKTGAKLANQKVTVVEKYQNWYKVQTWLGDKWIYPNHVIYDNKEIMILNESRNVYHVPNGYYVGRIDPQIVTASEKRGNWYKIATWLGSSWIKI